MGNGASVSRERWKQLSSYDKTEMLLLKGHFTRNVDDFKVEVEECIQNSEMDRLEILMSAHYAKDVHPIHIAAKLGSLEACELLLSAGFECMAKDSKGQIPLHCCPLNQLNESILCGTLLGLRGPKAANIRDKWGNTPLHIAVEAKNILSVASLLEIKGILTNLANKDGETPLGIAKRLRQKDIINLLDNHLMKRVYHSEYKVGRTTRYNMKDEELKNPNETVDQERIMKVWAAFFENAMKGCMTAPVVEEYSTICIEDCKSSSGTKTSTYFHSESKMVRSQRNRSKASTADTEGVSLRSIDLDTNSYDDDYLDVVRTQDPDSRIVSWFEWVCCFELESGMLYVINIIDGSTAWMEDHLNTQHYLDGIIPSEWNLDLDSYGAYPSDCISTVQCGWVTFYDHTSNDCFWYNIPSALTAHSLPIGSDLVCQSPWGRSLCMYPCPFSGCSVSRTPPHRDACRNSWVLVLQSNSSYPVCSASESSHKECDGNCNINSTSVNDMESNVCAGSCATLENCNVMQDSRSGNGENADIGEGEGVYYLNKLTGHSCWLPPEGWTSLVEDEWHGWILCISEDTYSDQFWWNPESGESVWQ